MRSRPGRPVAVLALVLGLLASGLSLVGGPVSPPAPAGAATGPPAIDIADPDTVPVRNPLNNDLVYATYGTTVRGVNACGGSSGAQTWYVPVIMHGSASSLSLTGECADADAMAGQLAAMAAAGVDTSVDIWAPTVSWFGDKYIMHYTAKKAGTGIGQSGQRCLWRATSPYPWGPFTGHDEFSCPGNGRWAIDADSFVDGGNLYVTYRDDNQGSSSSYSAIGLYRADSNGYWIPGTYRLLFRSEWLDWDYIASTGKDIIENPSILKVGNGRYYLFFSGHDHADPNGRYATGIADCGTTIGSGGTCGWHPMPSPFDPVDNPYFGWSLRSPGEMKTLPGDGKNPGGMSLFRTHAGAARVVWHSDIGWPRTSQIEVLCFNGTTNMWNIVNPCP